MRVFVTGATGFVGSAVVLELRAKGHDVTGLARSEAKAADLAKLGVQVRRGGLEDLDSLRGGARSSDAVIHTAFVHDFSRYQESSEIDRRAIEAMGEVLRGSDRPLVVTSGAGALRSGQIAVETDPPIPGAPSHPRVSHPTAAALAKAGVNAMVVRLPPTVHGEGDHGFVPRLIGIAREKGVSAYVGDGSNRWSAVHRLDAARVFQGAIEKGSPGSVFHAVAEEGIPFKEIASTIGQHLRAPVVSKSSEEAPKHFGFLAGFAGMDLAMSSARTREVLDWAPEQPGLLADLGRASYFSA